MKTITYDKINTVINEILQEKFSYLMLDRHAEAPATNQKVMLYEIKTDCSQLFNENLVEVLEKHDFEDVIRQDSNFILNFEMLYKNEKKLVIYNFSLPEGFYIEYTLDEKLFESEHNILHYTTDEDLREYLELIIKTEIFKLNLEEDEM